jgi:hypothetical protein
LGDRTNGVHKVEKVEKEKERESVASQDSMAERPKTRLAIDTRVPPVEVRQVPLETPIATSVVPSMAATPGTATTSNTSDTEGQTGSSTGEKKWRWTIGKKRLKCRFLVQLKLPLHLLTELSFLFNVVFSLLSTYLLLVPLFPSAFDRPTHQRTASLDPSALMATMHPTLPRLDTAPVVFSDASLTVWAASQRLCITVRGCTYNHRSARTWSSNDPFLSLAEHYSALRTYHPLLIIDSLACLDPMQYAARLLMQFEFFGISIAALFLVADTARAFDVLDWGCHAVGESYILCSHLSLSLPPTVSLERVLFAAVLSISVISLGWEWADRTFGE